jgi:hypothetical protein
MCVWCADPTAGLLGRCGVDTPEAAAALAEKVCALGADKQTAGAVRFAGIQVSSWRPAGQPSSPPTPQHPLSTRGRCTTQRTSMVVYVVQLFNRLAALVCCSDVVPHAVDKMHSIPCAARSSGLALQHHHHTLCQWHSKLLCAPRMTPAGIPRRPAACEGPSGSCIACQQGG